MCWLECGLRLKCDGTRAETRFRLSAKRTSPFKSAEAAVQSTTGSRGVHISGSNAGYTMIGASVKSTGCPLHSSVSPSLPLLCVTVCHHISTALYKYLSSAKSTRGSCVWLSEYSNTEQSSCLIILIIFVNLAGCHSRDSMPVYRLNIIVIIVSVRQVSCSEIRRCSRSDVVIHWCN
jgi:hypothetical protein